MTKYFVNRPIFTAVVFIVLLVIGLFCLSNLPLDLLPDISLPTMTIMTPYPGASAEEIETTVTKYIENAVATVPNVDKVISKSSENISTVTVSFKWGTNLDAAAADVREKLDLAKRYLPDEAQTITILKLDLSLMPVLVLGVSANESYPRLYQIADKSISDPLKRVKGVGSVMIMGGLERQINVDLDRSKLEAYHLSLNQIIGAMQASNLTLPAGNLKVGSLSYDLRVPGEYTSLDEIANTMVGNFQGRPIYLKDIATVSDGFKEKESMTQIQGYPGLMLMVQKQSGANTVNVVKEVKAALATIQQNLPPDVKIAIVMDGSQLIQRSISNLTSTLFWAFLFVTLTVFVFLRNFRASLIVVLTIPFSLIGSFIYLYLSGSTINMLSLASLAIAIGMVVDNAIVVLENIYRHRDEEKESPKEASIFGAGEVTSAVIASTITNLVVFLPIIMAPGFASVMFRQLVVVTAIVMSVSLFTSLTLTPTFSAHFMELKKSKDNWLQRFHDQTEKWFIALDEGYRNLLKWALDHRRQVVTGAVLIFILTLPLFWFVGTEFIPDMDQGQISASVELPIGTRWEETSKIMQEVEKIVRENVPEVQFLLVRAGSAGTSGFSGAMGIKTGQNYGSIMARLVPKKERKRSTGEIQQLLSKKIMQIPGVKSVDFSGFSSVGQLMGSGKPLSIEIYGHDLDQIGALAERIKAIAAKIKGVSDLSISLERGNPEFWIRVDRAKASALGLSMAEVSSALRSLLHGNAVTKYREAGEEYDIYLRLREEDRRTLQDLNNIFITSRTGVNVSLANIAEIKRGEGPLTIQRKNQERVVMVEGNLYGKPLGEVISEIKRELAKEIIPPGVSINFGGSAEQMAETFSTLRLALLLGILLVYLVMAAQFESWLDPFIITFSIPFGIVGVIWGLFLTGSALGVMPFVGMIMVVGVVVNNAIVLVDYTNTLRARGVPLYDAILTSGRRRLRPILMTTLTTILGLIPLALARGEGSELWNPMAIAVIGGLSLSTLVTLVFVPVSYYLVEERIKGRKFLWRK